jgi:glutathione peroxidase
MKRLKKILMIFAVLLAAFFIYVEIVNINSRNMTYRQKILKAVYPAWMWFTKLTGKNTKKLSHQKTTPPVSFYSLKGVLNNGDSLDFSTLKGKKVLLVNTASNCGYTDQYDDLQKLYEKNTDKLVVIGFPANDFKEQEKGSDEEIAAFCKLNYGVTFPLMKKSVVVKSGEQNPIYKWLTDAKQNGWNEEQPSWNFSKYLISEDGVLLNYFGPSISPTSSNVIDAIEGRGE